MVVWLNSYKLSRILLKIIFFLVNILILYYKPIYLVVFLLILSWEYLFFINFLYLIWRNYKDYFKLEIKNCSIDNLNYVEIWIEYLKLQAFSRIYILFSKPELKLLNLLKTLVIFLLAIPYRYLKLVFFFSFKNKSNFEDGLKLLYYQQYYKFKDCKIEIYEGKILINCYTFAGFLKKSGIDNLSKDQIFRYCIEVKKEVLKFTKFEEENKKLVKMGLGTWDFQDGKKINKPHFHHLENDKVIHATSNINFQIEKSQRIDLPISELIKPGAKNPGTIISTNIFKTTSYEKSIWVPDYALKAIKFNHKDLFILDNNDYKYMYEKDVTFRTLMLLYTKKVDSELCKELRFNCYSTTFCNLSDQDIINYIEELKNDFI